MPFTNEFTGDDVEAVIEHNCKQTKNPGACMGMLRIMMVSRRREDGEANYILLKNQGPRNYTEIGMVKIHPICPNCERAADRINALIRA